MFGVTIPHRLTAELPLHKGAKERYIAARCDIRLRRAIYFRFAKMRYAARLRTVSVDGGAAYLSVILPAAECYYGLRRSFIEACGFSVILFAPKLTEGQ